MTEEKHHPKERSGWPLTIVLLLMLLYLGSYAPVVRLMGGYRIKTYTSIDGRTFDHAVPIGVRQLTIYRPVDWLIDETPLRDPLLWWADVWGVRGPFLHAKMHH